jgi:hypothetical protein
MSQRQRKHGVLRITMETLHEKLGLPKDAVIDVITSEQDRGIANFYISSEKEIPDFTFDTFEGANIRSVNLEKLR